MDTTRPIAPLAGRIRTFAGDLAGTAGRIRTFSGSTEADAGRIRTFAGNLQSLAGRIRTFQDNSTTLIGLNASFWGTLVPQSGSLAASAGRIRTFNSAYAFQAGLIRAYAGRIRTFTTDPLSASLMMTQISSMVTLSKTNFGTAYQTATGKTFQTGFADPLLAKYHIDLRNPASLSTLDEATLELFLIDWNDNLMNYSGMDQTDHWMQTIGWNPAMTQQLSGGSVPALIGILDFTIAGDSAGMVVLADGISTVDGGHGTAVASLIASPHDGRAIMGIAPAAQITAYNPFDATMTAGWDDIRTGLSVFADARVSVVNMSLGVPGWTLNEGWNEVFSKDYTAGGTNTETEAKIAKIFDASRRQLFVLAAGNDGVVQPSDIEWNPNNPAIIVVGSVNPDLQISEFSNTPGTTCLLTNGVCSGADSLLMNRFLVAPGEFILVDRGDGGVARMSGTSFAAPLVSGTAALIADRWPWLSLLPGEIGGIILDSATDLGAPGIDPVYGHGLLNVAAALSPRDLNTLSWKVRVNGANTTYTGAQMAVTAVASKLLWDLSGAYATVYETTGKSFRDFTIPLSSKLVGTNVGSSSTQFMDYLSSRFWNWATITAFGGTAKFSAFSDNGMVSPVMNFGAFEAHMALSPRMVRSDLQGSGRGYDTAMSFQTPDKAIQFAFGNGAGAPAMGASSGFAMQSDYALQSGGANPFLGMASGSGFASVSYRFADDLTVSTGFSHHAAIGDAMRSAIGTQRIDDYAASALTLAVKYQPQAWLSATATYTQLDENEALLGMQSRDPGDLAGGSRTDAATFQIEAQSETGFALAASASLGRTRQGDGSRQNLRAGASGIASSAWQVSAGKTAVLTDEDSLRFSLAQTLHLDSGSIDFTQLEVVDRQTGELGEVTQNLAIIAPAREHVAEAIYRLPMLDGRAGLSLFGQMRLGHTDPQAQQARVTAGAGFSMRY